MHWLLLLRGGRADRLPSRPTGGCGAVRRGAARCRPERGCAQPSAGDQGGEGHQGRQAERGARKGMERRQVTVLVMMFGGCGLVCVLLLFICLPLRLPLLPLLLCLLHIAACFRFCGLFPLSAVSPVIYRKGKQEYGRARRNEKASPTVHRFVHFHLFDVCGFLRGHQTHARQSSGGGGKKGGGGSGWKKGGGAQQQQQQSSWQESDELPTWLCLHCGNVETHKHFSNKKHTVALHIGTTEARCFPCDLRPLKRWYGMERNGK